MLELLIEAGPQVGQRFLLATTTVLGRGRFAGLVIADLAVSRRHAEIALDGSTWILRDLESANGTRHNGKLLLAPVALNDGDTIEVGQTRLRVHLIEAPESAPERLPPPVDPVFLLSEETMAASDSRSAMSMPDAVSSPLAANASESNAPLASRLRCFERIAELLAEAGGFDRRLRDALAALAEVFPECRRMAVIVRDSPHRPWRVLVERDLSVEALDLTVVRALIQAMGGANRVLIHSAQSVPASIDASLQSRIPKAAAVVRVQSGGEPLGILYLDAEDGHALAESDADFLMRCAGLFGALLAAHRHDESGRWIQGEDLDLIRRIQQRFLPMSTPRLDGYEIADHYRPARIVGGDLFDFLFLSDRRLMIFVGDVSGKGVPAALLMARVGNHLRAESRRARNVVELLTALDVRLQPELERGMFMTAVAAALDPERGVLEIASAGHPMPLLRRADARIETLPTLAAPALGVGGGRFHEIQVELSRGDGLLFYTDGLDESRDEGGAVFGLQRVKDLLVGVRSAGQAIEVLTSALESFQGNADPYDDVAMVALWRR